jgi:hypothetical protein
MSTSIEDIVIAVPDGSQNFYSVKAELTRDENGVVIATSYLDQPREILPEPPPPEPLPEPEPLKLNLHKYVLEKLLVDKTVEEAAIILAFFIGNSKTSYLLSLGEILVAPYIDLVIALFGQEVMDEDLKSQIVTILNDLKGSI